MQWEMADMVITDPPYNVALWMETKEQAKARVVEFDPKYVQTIVNRMRKLDSTLVIKRNWVIIDNTIN